MENRFEKFFEKYNKTVIERYKKMLDRKVFVSIAECEIEDNQGYCVLKLEEGEVYRIYFRKMGRGERKELFEKSLWEYAKSLLHDGILIYGLHSMGGGILVVRSGVGVNYCDFELGLTLDDLDEQGEPMRKFG